MHIPAWVYIPAECNDCDTCTVWLTSVGFAQASPITVTLYIILDVDSPHSMPATCRKRAATGRMFDIKEPPKVN